MSLKEGSISAQKGEGAANRNAHIASFSEGGRTRKSTNLKKKKRGGLSPPIQEKKSIPTAYPSVRKKKKEIETRLRGEKREPSLHGKGDTPSLRRMEENDRRKSEKKERGCLISTQKKGGKKPPDTDR